MGMGQRSQVAGDRDTRSRESSAKRELESSLRNTSIWVGFTDKDFNTF